RTFACELTVPLPPGVLSAVAMGHASEGPLLVYAGPSPTFFDLDTMKKMVPENGDQKLDAAGNLRVSADRPLVARYTPILTLNATGSTKQAPAEFATDHRERVAIPGPGGEHIFSPGALFNSDGKKGAVPEAARIKADYVDEFQLFPDVFLPACQAPFFLRVPV